jgi:hypothetical protein
MWLMMAVAVVVPSGLAIAEALPKPAQVAPLSGNWSRELDVLGKSDLKEADASCRMVAAHPRRNT